MSDVDLTKAIEVARLARRTAYFQGHSVDECVAGAVRAGAPLIERQVREQVVREIEAAIGKNPENLLPDETPTGRTVRLVKAEGMRAAARIARGGA